MEKKQEEEDKERRERQEEEEYQKRRMMARAIRENQDNEFTETWNETKARLLNTPITDLLGKGMC